MWQLLHDAWWRLATQHRPQSFSDALACRLLQAGSVAYRAAVALRNAAYDRGWCRPARLPCRVVSVGNLTVGGTGKTACVELIASRLAARGRRVAVLSRGYGGTTGRGAYWLQAANGRLLVNGRESAAPAGLADEPQLLAAHLEGLPVVVGARRDQTGRLACQQFACEAIVLDDGFQHRQLARDCEIVLVHARMPLDGWAMLPRGPMREPLGSLARADVIIVTKADEALPVLGALKERLRVVAPKAALMTAVHAPTGVQDALTGARHDPATLAGMRVGLVSSIGDPAAFEATLQRLHATVLWHRVFPDHHAYRLSDWQAVVAQAGRVPPEALLTTEKDWVRLRTLASAGPSAPVPLWVLRVAMRLLDGAEELDARLAGLYVR